MDNDCYSVSFQSLVKNWDYNESDLFIEEAISLFDATDYIMWDQPYFEDLFELFYDCPEKMKNNIYEYICDKRLLFTTS